MGNLHLNLSVEVYDGTRYVTGHVDCICRFFITIRDLNDTAGRSYTRKVSDACIAGQNQRSNLSVEAEAARVRRRLRSRLHRLLELHLCAQTMSTYTETELTWPS